MNTVRRPRRRPRVKSFRFRILWWVLTREAALRVLTAPELWRGQSYYTRGLLARRSTWWVKNRAGTAIALHPSSRFPDGYPSPTAPSSTTRLGGDAASGGEAPQAAQH